ncbi:Aldo/keto reductase [Corynespora cassiicola Philippines]|uniref:Aldo/keto reductase n=1 Tax=Corynespora cassiicola Philippines TaxID=1448308 RepID=A0A2T2NA33_CORCC|nr:Aldo/keto reductase [Corynespora cassiicola Philippines]
MERNRTELRFKLNTGASIPAIGIGTWHVKGSVATGEVKTALQAGYRHVDTAFAYGNEKEVGDGIKASGVPREDIWLTTKLDHRAHHRVEEALEESLKNLGVDYLDLYLMHWPCATDPKDTSKHLSDWNFIKTWEVMQKLPETGKVKNIGICNVQLINLENLLSHPSCKVIPAVNQIELHPNHPSTKLVKVCQSKGIHVTAYSCLGSEKSPLLSGKDEVLNQIAESKGKTQAQILLSWGIQRGTSVLPRSTKPDRIRSNFDLGGWELSEDEMKKLNAVKDRFKACGDGFLPIRVFFDDDE